MPKNGHLDESFALCRLVLSLWGRQGQCLACERCGMFQCEPGAAQPSVPGPGTMQAPCTGHFLPLSWFVEAGGMFNREGGKVTKDCC